MSGGTLNLEKQLCFYSSYHQHPVNVIIHMICIPMIMFTSFLLATNTPTVIPLPSWLTVPYLPLNLGTLAALYYTTFYILLEPFAGFLLSPILLGSTAIFNYLVSTSYATHTSILNPSPSWSTLPVNQIALAIWTGSWIAQFIGHGAFEGRAPALFTNLHMSLVTAPFFECIELLFLMGYRRELKSRVRAMVDKQNEVFKKEKAEKAARKASGNGNVKKEL